MPIVSHRRKLRREGYTLWTLSRPWQSITSLVALDENAPWEFYNRSTFYEFFKLRIRTRYLHIIILLPAYSRYRGDETRFQIKPSHMTVYITRSIEKFYHSFAV